MVYILLNYYHISNLGVVSTFSSGSFFSVPRGFDPEEQLPLNIVLMGMNCYEFHLRKWTNRQRKPEQQIGKTLQA